MATTSNSHFSPWLCRAAFPLVSGSFYVTQIALAYSVYQGWVWLSVPLMLLASHLMHGLLIGFHEASHGFLRKSRFLNELDGILVGILSFTSFTLYRVLHQSHHVHFATEKDAELWPFVHVDSALWLRRFAAFAELNFGLFFTPFLFWRGFFGKDTGIRNPKIRRRIWMELILAVVFWTVAITAVAYFQLWPWFFWNYLGPGFIAGNLQSWRKYIEHVGMSGNTARSATRSIVSDTWTGHAVSIMLLHEPLHGIHHLQAKLPHYELPWHIDTLRPMEDGDTTPFPNYRSAIADLLRKLPDPKAGGQWEKVELAKA